MQRLIRIVFIGFIVLTFLCGMTIYVGRTQPKPDILPELKPCGASLCYLGIVLGKTSLNDGTKIVRENKQLEFHPAVFSLTSVGDTLVYGKVEVYFPSTPFLLGNIVNLFGSPCYVKPFVSGLDIGYPNAVVHLADSAPLTPSSLVSFIDVQQSTDQPCTATGSVQWRGFRDYNQR
jgi:hypothetical protein